MRVGVIPESLLERLGMAAGVAPVPLAEVGFAFLLARTVMVGTRLGVFEALAGGAATAADVAARLGTEPVATGRLLRALAGCRYLVVEGERFALAAMARRFLLEDSDGTCRDRLLFEFLEWQWSQHFEEYVRSGRPIAPLEALGDEEQRLYQRGMRAGIDPLARELALRLKLPSGATAALDLGGGHGLYSVALCRRHPALSATILEREEAIRHAAPLLAREGMGARVVHRAGDLVRDDLGEGRYDVVLLCALVHHFTDDDNRALMGRVARALRPGGVAVVFEAMRGDIGARPRQVGALMDLFLATISPAGTRFPEEIAAWQQAAGLRPRRPLRLRLAPDLVAQAAVKPAVKPALARR